MLGERVPEDLDYQDDLAELLVEAGPLRRHLLKADRQGGGLGVVLQQPLLVGQMALASNLSGNTRLSGQR